MRKRNIKEKLQRDKEGKETKRENTKRVTEKETKQKP